MERGGGGEELQEQGQVQRHEGRKQVLCPPSLAPMVSCMRLCAVSDCGPVPSCIPEHLCGLGSGPGCLPRRVCRACSRAVGWRSP